MRVLKAFVVAATLTFWASPANAGVIDFEDFIDGDLLTNQIADIAFSGLQVVTAGVSLNEIDFPPEGGSFNAAVNNVSVVSLIFGAPVSSVSGYFTYTGPVTLSAYSGATLLGSVTSLFSTNYTTGGEGTPNELLTLAGLGSFDLLEITTANEQSFVVDTLNVTFAEIVPPVDPPQNVPEPSSLSLIGLGAAACLGLKRRRTN